MPAAQQAKPAHIVGLIPVITFVLWTGCLVVGGLGYALDYARPQPLVSPTPVIAEKITVELDGSPQLSASNPAKPTEKLNTPPPAPPLAFAAPSPALAFPLSASKPMCTDNHSRATSSPQTGANGKSSPIQQLVFGQGEGRQPLPHYPSTAKLIGQEGTVRLHIDVNESGAVTAVQVLQSSHWPLLDTAAIDTVRKSWRFSPGATRVYEVSVPFVITQ